MVLPTWPGWSFEVAVTLPAAAKSAAFLPARFAALCVPLATREKEMINR